MRTLPFTLLLLACAPLTEAPPTPRDDTPLAIEAGFVRQGDALESTSTGLPATLGAEGLVVRTETDLPGPALRFSRWGAPGRLVQLGAAAPSAVSCDAPVGDAPDCAARAERTWPGVREWWLATDDRLEQGWEIEALPDGGELELEVEVGDATVKVGDGWATLIGRFGRWSYGDVRAWDATGAPLPASLSERDGALVLSVDVAGAVAPVLVDPIVTTADQTWTGGSYEYVGYGLAGGDLNGDGYDDVVLGAYGYGSHGAVRVYNGGSSGPSTSADKTVYGSGDDVIGRAVAVGDLDADGYAELIVGSNYTSADDGAIYVWSGSSSGIGSSASFSDTGSFLGYMGFSVAFAGDVNGDGYGDVITGLSNYGTARVYYGASGGLDAASMTTLTGKSTEWYGYAVAGVGDTNGDGYDDVAVSSPEYNTNTGQVKVYEGTSSGISTSAGATLTGSGTNQYFGMALAGGGDTDGDGLTDVVVGAYYYSTSSSVYWNGYAGVYPGSSGGVSSSASFSVTGAAAYDYVGCGVALTDFDVDGYADAVVGAYGEGTYGDVHVYPGSSAGTTTTDAVELNPTSGTYTGQAVGIAGDVNGDGHPDLLVGDPYHAYKGQVTLYLGYSDRDGDGYYEGGGGTDPDCDDDDATIYPGAPDAVGDGVDGDCDGAETCYVDADGDGYRTPSTVASADSDCADAGEALGSAPTGDCDDATAARNPGEIEGCDAADVDEDCDGAADDADSAPTGTTLTYADEDGDTYGDPATGLELCDPDPDRVADATDCADREPTAFPGGTEVCGNGVDEDCSGADLPCDDTGGDTGADTGGDTGTDTSTDSGADTGSDTGADTGTDTSADSGSDTDSATGGSGTPSGEDTGEGREGTLCGCSTTSGPSAAAVLVGLAALAARRRARR